MRSNVVQVRNTPNLQNSSDLSPTEQQRECPECGEAFTLRGLYGHLRLAHGKKGRELAKAADTAKPFAASEVEDVAELLRRFRSLVSLWCELDVLHRAGGFKRKADFDRLRDVLNRQADTVEDGLRRHGITITDEYKRHVLNRERSTEDEAEEEKGTGEE